MGFCSHCGANIAENAAFCPSCGKAQPAVNTPVGAPGVAPEANTGLAENVAGTLCYSLGWLTGLIFFVIDKRPFVRWHAAQSIVTFGAIHIIYLVLGMFFAGGMFWGGNFWSIWGPAAFLFGILRILSLVLWIVCMVRAYKGERFRLPIAANIADSFVK
jgi:uncharacterized membrane protein